VDSSSDAYISKFDSSGNFLWAQKFGATSYDEGNAVAIDNSGNAYIAGNFQSTVDFDPGLGFANFTSAGQSDTYILKFTSSGEVLSVTTPSVPTTDPIADAEAAVTAAKAAAAKREAEKQQARAYLVARYQNSESVTADNYASAEIAGVTALNLKEVTAETLALSYESRSDINQIIKVARKFEVVGLIASNQAGRVYPNMYVEIGLIPETSKIKTSLVVAVRRLPTESRDSYNEIKAAIDAKAAELHSRKDRLASIITRIKSR
jgi:hypothetical protein